MKKCIEINCESNQFGGGFCKYHQFKRRMRGGDMYQRKPLPKKHLKPESVKRKKQNIRYREQVRLFWEESFSEGRSICFFCGQPMTKKDNIHHLKGRTNDYLLDKEWWVNCHNDCHVYKYHMQSVEKRILETWYQDFLNRLREKDEGLYQKEKNKEEKSELDLEI